MFCSTAKQCKPLSIREMQLSSPNHFNHFREREWLFIVRTKGRKILMFSREGTVFEQIKSKINLDASETNSIATAKSESGSLLFLADGRYLKIYRVICCSPEVTNTFPLIKVWFKESSTSHVWKYHFQRVFIYDPSNSANLTSLALEIGPYEQATTVWMGTTNGLVRYDVAKDRFKMVPIPHLPTIEQIGV